MKILSQLVCTIVQNVLRATGLVNATSRFLDAQGSKTPEPIDIKLDRSDYVGTSPDANFGPSPTWTITLTLSLTLPNLSLQRGRRVP